MVTVDLTQKISERRARVEAHLRKQDLYLPRRPRYELPRLPVQITEISDPELMSLLVQFTRYQDYVAGRNAVAEIEENAYEQQLDVAKARFLAETWTSPSQDRVNVSKAKALVDPEVQALSEAYEMARARRKLLTIMTESLARDAAVVSRELTRRVGREPTERRADRHS